MQEQAVSEKKRPIDYVKVEASAEFKEFLGKKYRFLIPMTIFFLVFYFLLPIMTSYSTVLNASAIGDISWAWLFAFAQFLMTWIVSGIYVKKASSFDEDAEKIIERHLK